MNGSDINIGIGAEFTGKKAFKQAETTTDKLTKSVKKLAVSFGVAFSTRALVNYSKLAVRAFAADENAARSLGMTLKNLNLDYFGASSALNMYISNLEKQTGVLDDELRPAMDRFLRATSSITESQKLLNLALDISSGTGKDLTAVSQGLQKAYLGNNASLGRLGVGLTKAELKSSSFVDIQDKLTALFAGQAVSAADSYAGSLAKLTVASNNAKEIIGKDLVDAMQLLSGDEGIGGATTAMENFATEIGNVIYGIGLLGAKLNSLPILKDIFGAFADVAQYNVIGLLARSGGSAKAAKAGTPAQSPGQRMAIDKANKDAVKLQKTQNDLKKIDNANTTRKLVLSGDELALKELEKKFDVERIGLYAALNQSTEGETRLRLLSLIAIHDQNAALAGMIKKANETEDAFGSLTEALRLIIRGMLDSVGGALAALQARIGMQPSGGLSNIPAGFSVFDGGADGYQGFGSGMSNLGQNNYGGLAGAGIYGGGGAAVINYNINASGIGDQQIASVVQNAIQDLNRYGSSTTFAGAL
jgi:hypothetical protein